KTPPSSLDVHLNGKVKCIRFPKDIPELKSSLGIYDKTINDAYLKEDKLYIVSNDPEQVSPKIYEAIFGAQKVLLEEGKEVDGEIVADKLVDLIKNVQFDDAWWNESIGNSWTMKSFLCKDGKYYEDFLLDNQGRLKKLLKRAQYDLSKITSRGLNLFGILDVTHGVSKTDKTGVPHDIVGDQLKAMIDSITVWPGYHQLPKDYMTDLKAIERHISTCDTAIKRKVDSCDTCSQLRQKLRLSPQAIVNMIAAINSQGKRIDSYADKISVFFPFNKMFAELLAMFLKAVKKKNYYRNYYVAYDTSYRDLTYHSPDLRLWSLLIFIFDDGISFNNAKGYHSMSDCDCGEIIKESDYRYCGKFYIGSKNDNAWEWVNYLNLEDPIPQPVRKVTDRGPEAINNAYVFEMFVYDQV
ncbi:hypothetical protein KA005_56105, partial [bacterium]|nr:hypothetical protein [bacterium]